MDGSVLLMDYSELEREIIKLVLGNIGDFEVVEISDISQFNMCINKLDHIRLVIMDISFPSPIEGFEALQKIRQKAGQSIPVILVTRLGNPEIKQEAAKYSVKDFITKPYSLKRMEDSIRSMVKISHRFSYSTSGIQPITMTFDEHVNRMQKFMERLHQPFSVLLITPVNTEEEESMDRFTKKKICRIIFETTSQLLRVTDNVVMNEDKDVLVLLPTTDEAGAKAVCDRLEARIAREISKTNRKYSDLFHTISVSYPKDGDNFQRLMESAFKKITDKEMLKKITSIPMDMRKYANNRYNQFRKLF